MTTDLDALEALAKAADNWGGWAIWPDLTEGGFVHVGNEDGVIPEGQIATPDDAEPNPIAKAYTPEIADFIAAADPSTVLALIAELRQERERADEAEKKLEMPCGSCHPCTEWANQTWVNAGLRLPHVIDWQEMTAALSRAEETIARLKAGGDE